MQANLTQLSNDLNADRILKSPDMIISEFNNHKSKLSLVSLECLNFLPLIEVPMLPMKDKPSDVSRPCLEPETNAFLQHHHFGPPPSPYPPRLEWLDHL
jgi:hypothetical protein